MSAEHHGPSLHIPFDVMGVPLDITTHVIVMWGVGLFIFLFCLLAMRFGKFRQIQYFIYDFVQKQFLDNMHTSVPLAFSFIATLFLFIFFSNLSGLIPGSVSPTSNISVTAALAIGVFVLSLVVGFISHGPGHIRNFIPSGVPKFMIPFIFPLEIVGQLARPLSLSIRLFANLFAGHMVLTIFLGFVMMLSQFLKVIPFLGVIALSMFEIFVSFIQAFIFTYLTALYMGEAIHPNH